MCVHPNKTMARTKKTLYVKQQHGEGVRPETSQDNGEWAPKKFEKKDEHLK